MKYDKINLHGIRESGFVLRFSCLKIFGLLSICYSSSTDYLTLILVTLLISLARGRINYHYFVIDFMLPCVNDVDKNKRKPAGKCM